MVIKESLKKKSIIALAVYLALFIAIFGSITYWVVESPVRAKLEQTRYPK
ncbi:sensor histidine kinase [Vibrio variabilis]|uniref:Sensor histidine kinase n=1 Tax=Vibrio variabilis TaxID=990271 RepID=A0ABQ0JPZ6_9VIBR|nr:sensor histidine kinase [Vibrio variabilis]